MTGWVLWLESHRLLFTGHGVMRIVGSQKYEKEKALIHADVFV